MKKTYLIYGLVTLMLILTVCNKNLQTEDRQLPDTPTPDHQAAVNTLDNTQDIEENDDDEINNINASDYYPLLSDVEYIYSGEGNEFAAYNRFTDFLSEDGSRIQTRTNNGGTETVDVIEVKDGKVTVIKTVHECYYRDNIMTEAKADEQAEILLMDPLTVGTEWMLTEGRRRYISGTDVKIATPYGDYRALEVTTESDDSIMKDYYVREVGLVKTIFTSGDYEVISELSEIKQNAAYTRSVDIFYPGTDENIYVQPVILSFKTGDITRLLLQKEICKAAIKEDYLPLASTKTTINSLYLGSDGIAYIDFSAELVTEMNAGAGYETLILQCIANTVGNYYGTDKVYITVNGNPYESGHILMKKGETFRVDMSNVVR